MPRVLTKKECSVVESLKEAGILINMESPEAKEVFGRPEEVQGFFCSDRHADTIAHLRKVLGCNVLHPVDFYGGPLIFAKNYREHRTSDMDFVYGNIVDGMELKKLQHLYVGFHAPCGKADKYGHSIIDVVSWIPEVMSHFIEGDFFKNKEVGCIFQFQKEGKEDSRRQKSYLLDVQILTTFIEKGGLKKTEY